MRSVTATGLASLGLATSAPAVACASPSSMALRALMSRSAVQDFPFLKRLLIARAFDPLPFCDGTWCPEKYCGDVEIVDIAASALTHARYYFDIRDSSGLYPDEEEIELADLRAAEMQAAVSLAHMIRDATPLREGQRMAVEVRIDERPLFQVAIIFEVTRLKH